MRRVALVGFGSVGRAIVKSFRTLRHADLSLIGLCVRPHQQAEAADQGPPGMTVCSQIGELLLLQPDVVIEAAGSEAAVEIADKVLHAGKTLYLLSMGILANPQTRRRLLEIAQAHNGQISIPAGALAGFDGLLAMAGSGLSSVRYVSTKPPWAWSGTPAAGAFQLDAIAEPTTIFCGNAADAARLYPKNANLAAAVALAGVGFEDTQVELIADPRAKGNSGMLEAVCAVSRLCIKIENAASSTNPKTSAIVGASVLSALANQCSTIRFV